MPLTLKDSPLKSGTNYFLVVQNHQFYQKTYFNEIIIFTVVIFFPFKITNYNKNHNRITITNSLYWPSRCILHYKPLISDFVGDMLHCFVAEEKKEQKQQRHIIFQTFWQWSIMKPKNSRWKKILSNMFDLQKMQNNVPEDKDKQQHLYFISKYQCLLLT